MLTEWAESLIRECGRREWEQKSSLRGWDPWQTHTHSLIHFNNNNAAGGCNVVGSSEEHCSVFRRDHMAMCRKAKTCVGIDGDVGYMSS